MAANEKQDDTARLIGSAYALICAAYSDGSVFPILQALKCQCRLLLHDTPIGREIAGDAALYANPADPENIADQMMIMYKDESLRTALIEKGKMAGARYSLKNLRNFYGNAFAATGADYKPADMN